MRNGTPHNRFFRKLLGSIALSLALAISMVPAMAFADSESGSGVIRPGMSHGTSAMEKWDVVYLGTNAGGITYDWLVLDANAGSATGENDRLSHTRGADEHSVDTVGNGNAMFLLSRGSHGDYSNYRYILNDMIPAVWGWVVKEGGDAVLATYKKDAAYTVNTAADLPGANPATTDCVAMDLENKKLFLMSAEEVYRYMSTSSERELLNVQGKPATWFTRTTQYVMTSGNDPKPIFVMDDTQNYCLRPGNASGGYPRHCRPAFNLDKTVVLFTSTAEGGKLSSTVGVTGLKPVSTTNGNEWKLTLLDNSTFALAGAPTRNGNIVSVNYSGSSADRYVSAIVEDSAGNVKYYGRLTSGADTGKVDIDLSEVSITAGDKLSLFSEKISAGNAADYGSALQEVAIPDKAELASRKTVSFNANGGSCPVASAYADTSGKLTALPTPTRGGYRFDGWFTDAQNGTKVETTTTFSTDTTIYAHWTQLFTASLNTSGLTGATAKLNTTANIPAGSSVTVTITPNSGKSFDIAPSVTVSGSTGTVGTVAKQANGSYTCTILNVTGNLAVTVSGVCGHVFTNYKSNNNATCTKDGTETAKCKNCNVTDTRVAAGSALGHDVAVVKGYAAQIGIAGLADGSKCNRCGYWAKEQTAISPLNPKGTSITKVTASKKAFTVKWKKSAKSNCTGYQIRYSLKSSMKGAKTVTVKKVGTTKTKIKKLKAKKKYYVQIRVYKTVNGKQWYSSWSKKAKVTTKK